MSLTPMLVMTPILFAAVFGCAQWTMRALKRYRAIDRRRAGSSAIADCPIKLRDLLAVPSEIADGQSNDLELFAARAEHQRRRDTSLVIVLLVVAIELGWGIADMLTRTL
jgi:hypothetical protein